MNTISKETQGMSVKRNTDVESLKDITTSDVIVVKLRQC